MSGANGLPDEITLEELAKLIRILGMMGSGSDGEALNAARLAVRWVREKATDWETLLTPPEAVGVTGVLAVPEPDESAAIAREDRAYRDGYQAGLKAAMAQVKAQARTAQYGVPPGSQWTSAFTTMNSPGAQNSPGSPLGGFGAPAGAAQGPTPQGPVRAPAAPAGGYPPGSWQAVAQELLERDDAGVPGVLRSRERSFVADVLHRGFPTLTQAQEHWLRDIAGRNHMSW